MAFSGAQTIQVRLNGTIMQPYGSFAGKAEAGEEEAAAVLPQKRAHFIRDAGKMMMR